MRYLQILLEYNLDRLINDFSQKLLVKWINDDSTPDLEGNKETLPKQIIELISHADPTPNKEYTFWLISRYANNGINLYDDIESKAIPTLAKFHKLKITKKLKPEHRDINQIKTLGDLMDITDQYQNAISKREEASAEEQKFYDTKQATLFYNNDQVKIVIPHTQEASCFFGINTRWCTAATDSKNYFKYYNSKGPLYIVLIKKENKRYQFQFVVDQFMNELDEPVNTTELGNQYPFLNQIFKTVAEETPSLHFNPDPSIPTQIECINKNPWTIQLIKNPKPVIQKLAVSKDSAIIRAIKNQTDEAKWIAITADPRMIKWIENPTEDMLVHAVSQDNWCFRNIDNPSPRVMMAAIMHDPFLIGNIENPDIKLVKAALKRNPRAISKVKNQTKEIQEFAVREDAQAAMFGIRDWNGDSTQSTLDPSLQPLVMEANPSLIQFITDPTPETQMVAVKHNPRLIKDINNPEPKVVHYAIKTDPTLIKWISRPDPKTQAYVMDKDPDQFTWIRNPTEEIQLKGVNYNPAFISQISNPSEAVQLATVKKDGLQLGKIDKPSEEVQIAAVTQDPRAVKFIRKPSDKVRAAVEAALVNYPSEKIKTAIKDRLK